MKLSKTAGFGALWCAITVGLISMANAQSRTMVYVSNALDQSITVAELDTATGAIQTR